MPKLISEISAKMGLADAQVAVRGIFTQEPVSARNCEEQGMFSRTILVTLDDDTQLIVQLKDTEINMSLMALARSILGNVVPSIQIAESKHATFTYISEYIPGELLANARFSVDQLAHVSSQIATCISKLVIGLDSAGVVDNYVVPRLRHVLLKRITDKPDIQERVQQLLDNAEKLKSLPLALTHIDINARNIIVDGNARVQGLLDWEQAGIFPFGMGAWCIRYLSVETVKGKDVVNETSLPMAQAFWKTLISSLPPPLQKLQDNIVLAMQTGFVLCSSFYEGGGEIQGRLAENFVERFDWMSTTFSTAV